MSLTDSTAPAVRFTRATRDESTTHSKHGKHPIGTVRFRRAAHKGARRKAAMQMHMAVHLFDVDELDITPAYRQAPGPMTAVLTR